MNFIDTDLDLSTGKKAQLDAIKTNKKMLCMNISFVYCSSIWVS